MNLKESIRVGLNGVLSHKLRSSLTILGIIFGVSAVIAMLSIGEGAKQETLEQIKLMGMNNLIIKNLPVMDVKTTSFSTGLSLKDGRAIREICSFVESVAPIWEKTVRAQFGDRTTDIKLIGTTPEYMGIFNHSINYGKFFLEANLESFDMVCVIGNAIKNELFRLENPVGKMIKISDTWFKVIGVLEKKDVSSKSIGDIDISNINKNIIIPISTALYRVSKDEKSSEKDKSTSAMMSTGGRVRIMNFGSMAGGVGTYLDRSKVDQLIVKVKNSEDINEANLVIKRILDRKHYNADDYQIIIPEELLKQSQKTQGIFNIVMGAIAGISLLVGGIGIMNIMLASVLERTREIGIRRAVGASKTDVLTQFLIEAVALTIVGGIIGIILGFGMTKVISIYAGWKTIVDFWTILLAFSVSVATGIIFGFYPAKNAAEKEPIESLRYE